MLTNLMIVLPIFALILTGYIARKTDTLGPNATREVNRLVVKLALPALLFDIMANADPAEVWQPGFILAFSVGCGVIFAGTVWLRLRHGSHLADAAIDGLNAGYANTGFIGFPLVLAVVGPSGMAATLVASIITVCILFGIAIIIIEVALQSEASRGAIVGKTLISVAKNPLLVAPVLGAFFLVSGIPMPGPLDEFLKLLGGAATPCALIALGLFLAQNGARKPRAGVKVQFLLIALKLIGQPLLTWIVAVPLLGLPDEAARTAVLIAALPTGTGSFMLAEFYQREALLTGRVVLISTILSLVTLTALLAVWP
ncbi:AEC family transporter [Martelella endophytica]|uniref:Transporter n=1 Tax=Martelella endophytica TaxID=1486262 RepID=A0A0D5LSE5_MAREN|nr:AEC family transporter [Martelella endophytica]AJY46298.1 transporter [Martelella endophytica]